VLVVEGASDEEVLGELCVHGTQQVFAAGNRELVEQLMRHIRSEPIDGCDCLYLIDCDSYGKTPDLCEAADLVVSETCDLESDLVRLGAAERLAKRFASSDSDARGLVNRACALSLPLSIVRRAAFRCSVSMRRRGHQFRMADFSDLQLSTWDEATPTEGEVLESVASELGWPAPTQEQVENALPQIPRDFDRTTLGKDAIDALFWLLKREGKGEVRGWNLAFFYKAVAGELRLDDLDRWEVGRRFKAWESASGHTLMKSES